VVKVQHYLKSVDCVVPYLEECWAKQSKASGRWCHSRLKHLGDTFTSDIAKDFEMVAKGNYNQPNLPTGCDKTAILKI